MLHATSSISTSGTSESQLDHIAAKLVSNALAADDEKDLEEEYDPSDEEEEELVKSLPSDPSVNDDEKEYDPEEEEDAESLDDIDSMDEDAVINSKSFSVLLIDAMEHVSQIAKAHREEMIESIKEQIEEETGEFVDDEMMSAAMKTFAVVEDMDIGSSTDVDAESEEDDDSAYSVSDDDEPTALESQQILRTSSCWKEAMDAVRELAQEHQPEFVDRLCSIYEDINDEEPTIEEVHGMFSGIKAQFHEEAVETVSSFEDEDEVDAETLAEEMEIALVQVRKQAELDQEGLVNFICEYYEDFNGIEPSVEAISGIFGRIKEQFAESAREEFLELNQDDECPSDSDYEIDGDSDSEQYAEDEAEDIYIAGEHDAVSDDESLFEMRQNVDCEYIAEVDDAEEYYNDIVDEEELTLWASASADGLSQSECDGMSTEDEDDIVNSAHFAVEFHQAIQHVSNLAKVDQQRIVSSALDEATDSMVEEAMDALKAAIFDIDSEDDLEAEEELNEAMNEALESVRELGAANGEQLAMRICDLYREENGDEISAQKLEAIFSDVQECFAEEAMDDDSITFQDYDSGIAHPEDLEEEMNEALDHIREMAKYHQKELVVRLCAIYEEENCNEPTNGAIIEMFDSVRESFADEAMDELLDDDLEIADSEDEDSSYCPEEDIADHSDYEFDVLDDALYRGDDSPNDDDEDEDDDVAFDAEQDAEDLKALYAEDKELDDESSADEVEEVDDAIATQHEPQHQDLKQSQDVESDSEYSPDADCAFDLYADDYQKEYAATTTEEDEYTDTASQSGESEDGDYVPDYDLFDYSLDFEVYQQQKADRSGSESELETESELSLSELDEGSEAESESADGSQNQSEDDDDDDDYVVEDDSFDYTQDDIEQSVEEESEEDLERGSSDESQ